MDLSGGDETALESLAEAVAAVVAGRYSKCVRDGAGIALLDDVRVFSYDLPPTGPLRARRWPLRTYERY